VSVNVVPYKEGKRAVEISDTKRKLGKGVSGEEPVLNKAFIITFGGIVGALE
jgi:hypothetical protein